MFLNLIANNLGELISVICDGKNNLDHADMFSDSHLDSVMKTSIVVHCVHVLETLPTVSRADDCALF